ncbi:MAG: ATPase, partial [Firmicutes bacterium CAG:110_56_8]
MNIQEAKQEIIHTLQAYLRKDDAGNYLFPAVHQRPILLMGPPGIGKTAIMEQVARRCGVGLVAYTITHHTRQSAIGLPHIEEKTYGGQVMSVTEYTMSEIIASVYETMERTGCQEGILFLDEINCVSETLAPTMLQFLQNKTFGTHRVPEGCRVRQINVEADLDIWLDYAREKQLHGAVISYLSVKRERFYVVKRTEDNLSFVTARGWEDLSQILKGYEALQVPVTEALVSQFLHHEETARDFAAYYRLYQTYGSDYAIPEILNGTLAEEAYQERVAMARGGSFDERITVVNLVLDALGAEFAAYAREDAAVVRLHELLGRYKNGNQSLTEFITANRKSLEIKRQNALLSTEEARREEWVLHRLGEMELAVKQAHIRDEKEQLVLLRTLFGQDVQRREDLIRRIQTELSHGFRFVADCFGEGQEMILLVSALTRTPNVLT